MAVLSDLDNNDRVYYTIICDGCSQPFACYDDACYTFPSLRQEALLTGWDISERPDQPQRCPTCVAADSTVRSSSQPARHQPQPDRRTPGFDATPPGTAPRADLRRAVAASTYCQPAPSRSREPGRQATVRVAADMISVAGELDLATSDDIADRLRQALQAYEPGSTVILDLAQTEFIDARGCAALVRAYRAARERDLTLKLINARPIVAKVITLCRLHEAPTLTTTAGT